jgi:hypothetical protein
VGQNNLVQTTGYPENRFIATNLTPQPSTLAEDLMRKVLLVALLLSGSFLLAQDNSGSATPSKDAKGQVTVRGCVSRQSGDFILMKQDPAITYELQATGKIKLGQYMGQRVEVTGKESPSLSTSSDAAARISPSATTLTITSIHTLDKECSVTDVNR